MRYLRLLLCLAFSLSELPYLAGSVIDSRTLSPNAVGTRNDLNGIGETFVADAAMLQDASILVATPNSPQAGFGLADLWQHARIELRSGYPQTFSGTAGVIFRSDDINLATLPLLGQVSFAPFFDVRELKLSAAGLSLPIPLTVGATYTLDLIDLSGDATKYIGYLETFTLGLSGIGHNRSYSEWL